MLFYILCAGENLLFLSFGKHPRAKICWWVSQIMIFFLLSPWYIKRSAVWMYVVLHRCFSHSAQQKCFHLQFFHQSALSPRISPTFATAERRCIGVGASEHARCLWQLDDVAPQGWKKKSDGGSKKKEMSIFRFDVSTVFGDGGKCPAVQLSCICAMRERTSARTSSLFRQLPF